MAFIDLRVLFPFSLQDIGSSVVRLIVIANIMLNPPLVYLMQHCKVPYRVELLKQGKVHRKFIKLSHCKYFVQVYMQIRIAYYGLFPQRRRIPVWRVSLIVTFYYAELFPLVRRQRLFPIITVPILGMDLRPNFTIF